MTLQGKAYLFIEHIEQSLTRNIKHYNKAGIELKTSLDIMYCLIEEGSIECEDPSVMQGISNLLEKLRADLPPTLKM